MTGRRDGPIVVKCGGTDGIDRTAICRDVAAAVRDGRRIVLVHGGSSDIRTLARRLGVREETLVSKDGFVNRRTTPEMMDVVTLALAGKVKPDLVASLTSAGVRAVGLTGLDAGIVMARRKSSLRTVVNGRVVAVHDDQSGGITAVAPQLVRLLLEHGYTAVLSPPALGPDARPLNVDADRFAAAVAAGLNAAQLILLTGTPGLLANATDERSLIERVQLPAHGTEGLPGERGMKMKLLAAREALTQGVPVRIASGRTEHPLRSALAGAGTVVELAPDRSGSARDAPEGHSGTCARGACR